MCRYDRLISAAVSAQSCSCNIDGSPALSLMVIVREYCCDQDLHVFAFIT